VRLAQRAGTPLLLGNLLLQVAQGLVPLLGLIAMQQFLDAVAQGLHGDPLVNSAPPWLRIQLAVLFAAAVALGGIVLRALASQIGERHARLVADRCALDLQRHAASLDLLQLENPNNADLLHRAAAEAGQRPVRVVHNLAALVLAVVTFLALGSCLWTAAPWLPFLVALAAVPQAVARLRAARAQHAWQANATEAQRELGYRQNLLASRAAAKDLRLFGLGPGIADRVAADRATLTHAQLALAQKRAFGDAWTQALASVAMFAAYLWLARETLAGGLTLGGLLLQAQAVQRTQNGLRDALLAHSGLREDRLFLAHVFAFLALRPQIVAPAQPVAVPELTAGGFACRDLVFAYPSSPTPQLRGLSLDLRQGERVALVGANGAGKSTLVRLLCRLCDPDQGAVTYGGIDLRQMDPAQFRQRLSVFFQDAAIFEFSARENLALGAPELDEATLLRWADVVGIGDRLRALPRGLDTRLGRGFRDAAELSQGEWRKLLLARTLARPSAVLILDEPFAFLDADGQARLIAALQGMSRDRIVLVIDHRPQAIAFCDRVLVCSHGRIAQEGTPAAVLGTG
jgi:ATP-binding cassette subfamily B protein